MLLIPMNLAIQSEGIRPAVPIESILGSGLQYCNSCLGYIKGDVGSETTYDP
jgi:hypothetical protein